MKKNVEESEEGKRVMIGDYLRGHRIGWGSSAVVWKCRHRHTGMEVAIKEIEKKHLLVSSTATRDHDLLKEIHILSNIRHPNIIRLFQAIQTEDRIYLVLEYCDGGDLAAYINRHGGKVSQTLASHFMRQLAAGLQVLNHNRLIHRDLKPQNLLLSNTDEGTPLLKIGDFGFARYLTAQGLADTLCGSPLYMAPEIIQNKKYDGKADLWSAGAILYQLVTGRPPFDGDSQLQLFQNILTSSELQFPRDAYDHLHPDCLDLCRSLLRQNPVERLTFEEFFNHKFLAERVKPNSFYSSVNLDKKISCARNHGNFSSSERGHGGTSDSNDFQSVMQTTVRELPRTCFGSVTDSLESIEKDYVLVNAHFASMETSSGPFDKSMLNISTSGVFSCLHLKSNQDVDMVMSKNQVDISTYCPKSVQNHHDTLSELSSTTLQAEVQGMPVVHPQRKFQLLYQYICVLSELAQIKFNAGLYLESFSVELIVLAIWKKALTMCSSCLACNAEDDIVENFSADRSALTKENTSMPSKLGKPFASTRPHSLSLWAEQEFIFAFDRVEKLSYHVKNMDGTMKMPDAMEVIFQRALEVGKSGGVDELMGNKTGAATAYSKAKILMLFILEEATLLPLKQPFSLSPPDRERIKEYIANFENREYIFQTS